MKNLPRLPKNFRFFALLALLGFLATSEARATYNPVWGRFLSRDPAGEVIGGTNLYVFCGNNGVNKVDPMGLETFSIGYDGKPDYDPFNPSVGVKAWDNVSPWLGGASNKVNNNAFFEKQYPGWVSHMKQQYTEPINDWVCQNARGVGMNFKGNKLTDSVTVTPFFQAGDPYGGIDPDQNETLFGDSPQDMQSRDKVLGGFSFSLQLPVKIIVKNKVPIHGKRKCMSWIG